MSLTLVIKKSVISGIHRTKVGAHEAVALNVVEDDSIPHIDPTCMKVMFPTEVASCLLKEVTYPKNPDHRRFKDQLVEDVLGEKVGNVPANLCQLFRHLIEKNYVRNIKCVSTGQRPRPSRRPPTTQKFAKSSTGRDRRGGGLVIDCKYEIVARNVDVHAMVHQEVVEFLRTHDGEETLDQ